jgi:hypothetical protein
VIVSVIVSTVFIVASAAPAAAHVYLKASSPKDGGEIGVAPSRLAMEFTGPIVDFGHRVVVRGPDGRDYQAGAPRTGGTTLTQPLKPLGPPGEYRVTFRVVADDGHPLVSGIRFTLTKPGPAAGGGTAMTQAAPLAAVPASNSVNNAPSWAPWLGGALAMILVLGAVLFGRRVTRDLD